LSLLIISSFMMATH